MEREDKNNGKDKRHELQARASVVTKRNIAIGLCIFLTVAPILGSFIPADTTHGFLIGNLTPYIHLTMPQHSGLPFAESIGGLVGLLIILFGLVGFALYAITRFQNTKTLRGLLYLTILYCGFRAIAGLLITLLLFISYDNNTVFMIVLSVLADMTWGFFSYQAVKWLAVPAVANL